MTEYELMKILDENGFTTTDEDVALLKEALADGRVILEECEWSKTIDALIKDEEEAIDGYEKALSELESCEMSEELKAKIKEQLEHIRDEEKEHIEELKKCY